MTTLWTGLARTPSGCGRIKHDLDTFLSTSAGADKFRDILAAERSTVYVYDGGIPPGGIYDGTAYLIILDDENVSVGLIESDDPSLIERLTEMFEEYREASTRLTTSELESDQESVQAER